MSDTLQTCCNLQPFLNIIRIVIRLIQYSVPLLLLVLGTIDMVKAVASGDEKVSKTSSQTFLKRLMYGVLIFLVPFLLRIVLRMVDKNIIKDNSDVSTTSWLSCWNYTMDNQLKSVCSNYDDIYKD